MSNLQIARLRRRYGVSETLARSLAALAYGGEHDC
ncbi:hypothetical protein SAMN05444340_11019 [Citreimonas salinaria]|uniref:Uncharacterized protein n=1 Tax=Citreimonas salinaria TaxID=321339 RepID=A0A1H3KQ59_9RHOB|nr:hypothetical protein SAMN05444340_11019 [Citreimonas salinaria]